jgi:protein phosphatase 2C family protein 2/3
MQGWRISMEDSHTTVLDLAAGANLDPKIHSSQLSFFGVFDGHGGSAVALFAGENIHNIILKQDTFKTGDYAQGLKDGFLATDRAILNGMQLATKLFFLPWPSPMSAFAGHPPFSSLGHGRS